MVNHRLEILLDEYFLCELSQNPLKASLLGFHTWDGKYIDKYDDNYDKNRKKHLVNYKHKICSLNAKTNLDIANIEAFDYYSQIEIQLIDYSYLDLVINYKNNPFSDFQLVIEYTQPSMHLITDRINQFSSTFKNFYVFLQKSLKYMNKISIDLLLQEYNQIDIYINNLKNNLGDLLKLEYQSNLNKCIDLIKKYHKNIRSSISITDIPGGKDLYRILLFKYSNKNIRELLNLANTHLNKYVNILNGYTLPKYEKYDIVHIYEKNLLNIENTIIKSYFNNEPNLIPYKIIKSDILINKDNYIIPELLGSRPGIINIKNGIKKYESYLNSLMIIPGKHYLTSKGIENKIPLYKFGAFPIVENGWSVYVSEFGNFKNNNQKYSYVYYQVLISLYILLDLAINDDKISIEKAMTLVKSKIPNIHSNEALKIIHQVMVKPGYYISYLSGKNEIANLLNNRKNINSKFLQIGLFPIYIYQKYNLLGN